MSEVWIYASDASVVTETAAILDELGYSSRHVTANGTLRPSERDGGASRKPSLALVIADGGDIPAEEICARLEEDDLLLDVPCVVTLDPENLEAEGAVIDGHELIVRPFSAAELSMRIARARRQATGFSGDLVEVGDLAINLATYQVSIGGRPMDFTYMEYELLTFLATHPGRVFSREALLSRVWGYDYYGGTRTVDVHIRRLRAKLGREHAARITTVRSVGYRFDLEA
jgi:two-component system alkaline phosphatase synthesis response regulator PhoP